MAIIYFELTWRSDRAPEDVAAAEKLLEVSGAWERVLYAASASHPVTVIAVVKDDQESEMGELVISFRPCDKGFVESDMRSCIAEKVMQSLRGETGRSKRVGGDKERTNRFARRKLCEVNERPVLIKRR